MVEDNKTYVGVVEDNQDPKKMGRVKVRVMDVFDEIPLEDIPWAMPWKDLNGNQFNTPEKGKVVMVVFDQGSQDNPEFIYADHYNINLENKLKSLSDSDYTSMKSLIFDHKTQIYVNDSEGLKIDYKYNNINISESGINLNLKDNNTSLNLGDASANQQAVLGNHFMDWLEKLLDTLQSGGLFNGGGPAIANPALMKLIIEFKALKDIKFLSHHVNITDNNKIKTVKSEKREDDPQYGDKWVSTKDENNLTKKSQEEFSPKDGPKEEFNQPVEEEKTQSQSPTGQESEKTEQDNSSIGVDQNTYTEEPPKQESPIVERLVRFLDSKNYKVYKQTGVLNMVALRDKDDGSITNKFDETLYVFYLNESGNWEINDYNVTTVPGLIKNGDTLPENVNILAFGQYIDQCVMVSENTSIYKKYGKSLIFNECAIYENNKLDRYNYSSNLKTGNFNIGIFRSSLTGSAENVSNYNQDGSQVFKNSNQYKNFITLCESQTSIKRTFTYTLCRKSEFDNFN